MPKDYYENLSDSEREDYQARVESDILDINTKLFCPCGSCIAKKENSIIYDQNLHGSKEKWDLAKLEALADKEPDVEYTVVFLNPDVETCYERIAPGVWKEIYRGLGYVS